MREEDSRPFARELLLRRAAPFALAMAVSFAFVPLGDAPVRTPWLLAALALAIMLAAAAWFAPWQRWPASAEAIPALLWFGVVALLRESQDGTVTGYGPLLLLPVLWLLLYGTRRQVAVAIGCVALTLFAPILLSGSPTGAEVRLGVVWTVLAAVVAFTVLRLVEEIRRQSAELERLASTDALTGLANRRVWEDALPRELARSVRSGAPVAIALLDLDHFKAYNDSNGHQAGDLLLRHGGEEFALLLPDCGSADVEPVVEKVRRTMPSGSTASAGAAVWDGVEEAEELIRRADDALYEAKRSGRDRTVVAGSSRPEPAGA